MPFPELPYPGDAHQPSAEYANGLPFALSRTNSAHSSLYDTDSRHRTRSESGHDCRILRPTLHTSSSLASLTFEAPQNRRLSTFQEFLPEDSISSQASKRQSFLFGSRQPPRPAVPIVLSHSNMPVDEPKLLSQPPKTERRRSFLPTESIRNLFKRKPRKSQSTTFNPDLFVMSREEQHPRPTAILDSSTFEPYVPSNSRSFVNMYDTQLYKNRHWASSEPSDLPLPNPYLTHRPSQTSLRSTDNPLRLYSYTQ